MFVLKVQHQPLRLHFNNVVKIKNAILIMALYESEMRGTNQSSHQDFFTVGLCDILQPLWGMLKQMPV